MTKTSCKSHFRSRDIVVFPEILLFQKIFLTILNYDYSNFENIIYSLLQHVVSSSQFDKFSTIPVKLSSGLILSSPGDEGRAQDLQRFTFIWWSRCQMKMEDTFAKLDTFLPYFDRYKSVLAILGKCISLILLNSIHFHV